MFGMLTDLTIDNQLKKEVVVGQERPQILCCSSHQEVESSSSVQIWAGLMIKFGQENVRGVKAGEF